jgi:formiminoglutamase
MNYFNLLTFKQAQQLVQKRQGETRFFEAVSFATLKTSIEEQLKKSSAEFVLFGISEDIGVRANGGKTGAKNTWNSVLKTVLNIQSNRFSKPNQLLILGHFDFDKLELKSSDKKDLKKLRKKVNVIDADVTNLVHLIKKSGKTPIAVGGGHNNAYGLIKGCALASKSKINAINFDAHTDFRALEGRHSGNGFSYAMDEGFLECYFIFGVHENYTSESIYKTIDNNKNVAFISFESIAVRKEFSFGKALEKGQQFVSKQPFGIEVDCDAIAHCPSSAMTPTGFDSTKARQFVFGLGKNSNTAYLHICEAASKLNPKKRDYNVGKMIVALIMDFIQAKNS